jgi:hypothetical protein
VEDSSEMWLFHRPQREIRVLGLINVGHGKAGAFEAAWQWRFGSGILAAMIFPGTGRPAVPR